MTADIHFSPLALTHALPFLPLAQGDIDYQVDRRSEPGCVLASWRPLCERCFSAV
ncbi:hypothetical protein QS353_06910 [Bifidobacterium longum]|uniref:hypothetical protein n=1 Tax=Bifidobacterium longum TaxID=216816 RepID=UPI002573CC1B|nr:hypothetical protein [Bifidobacterium longum]MDL5568809.1 hypothetical protein [Bifidobacterium longum]